jgi:hypothetical protein
MTGSVELATLDLRYQTYRMRNPSVEARLLASIAERGIDQPLEGVEVGGQRVLLNGFKRVRCARRLGLGVVPYASLGQDEAAAILTVLRASNHHSLSILEQARFIDELRNQHRLSLAEIAATLWRSKAWVSMRLGLLGEMTPAVREQLFAGAFPVYAYMYTLRPFMRMNGQDKSDVEAFVVAVAGKNLSVREIDRLARGYFRGPESFRAQIQAGHLALVLERTKPATGAADACRGDERRLLEDLEIVHKYMRRVTSRRPDDRRSSPAFLAQADLLSAGILEGLDAFTRTVRLLHDRTGQA